MGTIGNIDSWKRLGRVFPKSGQGVCQLVESATAPGGEKFVLKTMSPEQSRKLPRRARFEQEIFALQRLNDPRILRIEDFGVDARDVPYMVTPYCALGSLRRELLPLGTIPETLGFFLGICQGVAHAHEAGVVHRDLKPANIFLTELRSAVVGDFGLCFLLDRADDGNDRITETQEVAVARWFGAPEARDGRLDSVSAAADVYSLGKLLHWMLSNGSVFDRENHRADRFLLGRGVADRREHELVHELLDRMIVYEPSERYQSAVMVLEAVANLIAVIEAGGRPILLNFAHRCSFCGQGEYEFRNGPEDIPRNQSASQSLGLAAYGVQPSNSSYAYWMVAICNKCAHVQFFRPDLVPEARKNWLRDQKG